MPAARPLTTEEKYYTFLGEVWPLNPMLAAELDRTFSADEFHVAWSELRRQRVVNRLAVDADLTLRDIGDEPGEVVVEELPSDRWPARMAEETRHPRPPGVSLRCLYLVSPAEQRSRIVFVGHHAIVDGRISVLNMQLLVRALDGQPVPEQQAISEPAAPRSWPWREDRRELVRLLHAMRDEQDALGEVGPNPWVPTDLPRTAYLQQMTWDAEESATRLAGMKQHRIRPLAAISAAWLSATQREFCGDEPATLQLGTAVDVAAPVAGDQLQPMNVGVVSTRYRVGSSTTAELATEISGKLASAVQNGQGDLFFDLSRIGAIDDLESGAARLRTLVETAPPTVSVTNFGIVDPGSDPEWLLWICGYMDPTPNHVVFVSGMSYRGQLVNSVTFDAQRVSPERAQRMVEHARAEIDALAVTP